MSEQESSPELITPVIGPRRSPDRLNPTGVPCARCGRPAAGHAFINEDRYCHGDEQRPSCYERQLSRNILDDRLPIDFP